MTQSSKKIMNQGIRNMVIPYLKSIGYHQKGAYFIRQRRYRSDVIEILVQPANGTAYAGFSFALSFISSYAYHELTGKRQPLLSISRKLLFRIPIGVLLCANENLEAGFDYWYEFYQDDRFATQLTYEMYQKERPDITQKQFEHIHQLYHKLTARHDHQSTDHLMDAVQQDIKSVDAFFSSLPDEQDMAAQLIKTVPSSKLHALLYASLGEYANYFGKKDLAIALQLQHNAYENNRKEHL